MGDCDPREMTKNEMLREFMRHVTFIKQIDEALEEMKRFQKAAMALKKKHSNRKKGKERYDWDLCGSPETGALRRASMDLTRALARMRRGRRAGS